MLRKFPLRIKPNLVYIPTPKNACTSIKSWAYQYNFGKEFKPFYLMGKCIYHIHNVYPCKKISTSLMHEEEFVFCVVREPFLRFVSAYCNRVLYHKDISKSLLSRLRLLFYKLPLIPDIKTFVENLDVYMKVNRQIKHHFLPQTYFLGCDCNIYTRIVNIKSLDSLKTWLEGVTSTEVVFPRLQEGGKEFKDIVLSELSEKHIDIIKKYYAKDYEVFSEYL
ncbi:MAG: sulfotransferase family 2 domain-containing protein [Gammaproteobacteria bacterium]|nr:sulfotransferase family 2 domain-containing protein [Gammaproteobacteria bacterium]